MSPLTVDRIKKAKQVRIVPFSDGHPINVTKFAVQIMEGMSWVNVLVTHDRQICEDTVRKANSKTILG
jgi:hypothetical protein